jgi:hypothetical protein
MNGFTLHSFFIIVVWHRNRILLSECDLFSFTISPAMLQRSLFLFNQINQSEYKSHFSIHSMTWSEEFFKTERRRVAKEDLQHLKYVLHEIIITMGCKFEALLGDMIRD